MPPLLWRCSVEKEYRVKTAMINVKWLLKEPVISHHVRCRTRATPTLCLQRDRRVNPTNSVTAHKLLPSDGTAPTISMATDLPSCANNKGRP